MLFAKEIAVILYKNLTTLYGHQARAKYLIEGTVEFNPDFLQVVRNITFEEIDRVIEHCKRNILNDNLWAPEIGVIDVFVTKPTLKDYEIARKEIMNYWLSEDELHPMFEYVRNEYAQTLRMGNEKQVKEAIMEGLHKAYVEERKSPGFLQRRRDAKMAEQAHMEQLEQQRQLELRKTPNEALRELKDEMATHPKPAILRRLINILERNQEKAEKEGQACH